MPINIDLMRSPMNWIFLGFAIILLSLLSTILFEKVS